MGLFRKKDEEKEDGKKSEKVSLKEKIGEGKLHCRIVIEIAGRPVDYIKEAMKLVLKGLEKEKEIEIISKKTHKPKKVQTIFSTFTEVHLLVNGLHRLAGLVFDYMPSSVEVLEPQYFKMDITDANNLLNDITAKLHRAEAVAKRFGMENEILRKRLGIKK